MVMTLQVHTAERQINCYYDYQTQEIRHEIDDEDTR